MNKLKFSTIGKIDVLLAFLLPLLVFIILARTPQDADMWWHLRAGQDMWQSKSILLTDTFSYTRYGQPWVNAFWISEIIFYLSYKLGEYLAITALVALTGATTFYYLFQRMEGNKFVNAFIIILATITAAPIWSPRPQIFSFLILALLDGWLNQIQKNNKGPLWILILVFALWANIHGGWIWGFLLLAAYIVGIALNNFKQRRSYYQRKLEISFTANILVATRRIGNWLESQRNLDLASAFYHCKRFDANPGMGFTGFSPNGISTTTLDVVPAPCHRRSCKAKNELGIVA